MTRIVSSADGKKILKSFSYFGPRDSNEVLRELIDKFDSDNVEAEKFWNSLTPEEKERRTAEFSKKDPCNDSDYEIPAFLRNPPKTESS